MMGTLLLITSLISSCECCFNQVKNIFFAGSGRVDQEPSCGETIEIYFIELFLPQIFIVGGVSLCIADRILQSTRC
jgi:hypothetical protein